MNLFGWVENPKEVERIVKTLKWSSFTEAAPELVKEEWQDVILTDIFEQATGTKLDQGPQKIGDCVSWGWSGFVDLTEGVEIAGHTFQQTCTEYIYGASRVLVGKQQGSYEDGSVGAWAAEAVKKYGVLSRTTSGPYDPQRAKKWGANGPEYVEEAQKHCIVEVTPVLNVKEAIAAIAGAHKPVPVCSSRGFTMTRDKDGFCRPSGSWNHCMLFMGYKGGSRPGLLCRQSWGPNTPSGPVVGTQPDNTFYVELDVADSMLKAQDSFTGMNFQGYVKKGRIKWDH
jgi:hypothetical protein